MFHVKQSYHFPIQKSDFSEKDLFLATKDHFLSQEEFELYRHPELDMLITIPQPDESSLPGYYESDSYISHKDDDSGFTARLYRVVRNYALRKKVRLISKLLGRTGSIADLGAGTGAFLEAARNKGWKVDGVEPNPVANKSASDRGIVLGTSIDDLEGRQFDVVTLWHVLEHLPDLQGSIEKISEMVKPGGVLIIAVPNFKSYDAKHYKQYWAAFDTPRHLWHFSRSAIPKLFENEMKLIKIKPMWFDSFYVSLLSEKYKSGKSSLFKAFLIGLRSNLQGISSGEYSSLQYCFRKSK